MAELASNSHALVESRGVGPEKIRVLRESRDLEGLYAERDVLQARAYRDGYSMTELRYGVRALGWKEEG